MKYRFLQSSTVDIFSLLSLIFFFVTTDHFIAPLGLLFLLSIFYQVTFIGVSFGLAIIVFLIASLIKNEKLKSIFKIGYIVLSVSCIGGLCFGNFKQIIETPSLISFLLFLIFISLMIWKWGFIAYKYYRKSTT